MARKLMVEIVGDASSLNRSLGEAEGSTSRFGGAMSKMAGVAKVAGLGLIAGVAYGLDKSVKAGIAMQSQTAALDQALKNAHISTTAFAGTLTKAEGAGRKFGFSNLDTRESLTKLVTATGDSKTAMDNLSVAEDLARFKHTSLASTTDVMTRAIAGSSRALKQLGIDIPPVTTHMDALRLSHMKTGTAAYFHAEALAKAADKASTMAARMDILKQKVGGQAQAFSDTAAGGMARFHAGLENLQETIGVKLLPYLGQAAAALADFVNYLSTSPGVAHAASEAFTVVKDVIGTLVAAGKLLLGWMQQHQTATKAIIITLGALVLAFTGPITIIAAAGVALIEFYHRSQTFRTIVNQAFDAVRDKVNEVMPTIKAIISGVITTVEALWHQFGSALTTIAKTYLGMVGQLFHDLAQVIGGVVSLIGDIIHGRWSKIWGDLKQIVGAALDGIKTIVSGEAKIIYTAALAIGGAMVHGVIDGIKSLASSASNAVTGFFGGLVSDAKHAVGAHSPSTVMHQQVGVPMGEGVISGWLEGTRSLPATMKQTLQNAIQAAQKAVANAKAGFQTSFGALTSIADQMFSGVMGAQQTEAGKKLAAMQAKDAANQLKDALSSAQDQLAQAQAGGDPAQILAAQKAVYDAQRAIQEAALAQQAADEQKELDARTAVKQLHFDRDLAALEAHLAATHASTKEAMKALTKLFNEYGVDFASIGDAMGKAWIGAFRDAIRRAAKGSGRLAKVFDEAANSIKGMASGGIVTRPTLALIGEAGPEAVVPLSRASSLGGQSPTINVTVNGWVGSDQQIAQRLRNELVSLGRREPNIFAGYA